MKYSLISAIALFAGLLWNPLFAEEFDKEDIEVVNSPRKSNLRLIKPTDWNQLRDHYRFLPIRKVNSDDSTTELMNIVMQHSGPIATQVSPDCPYQVTILRPSAESSMILIKFEMVQDFFRDLLDAVVVGPQTLRFLTADEFDKYSSELFPTSPALKEIEKALVGL